MRKYDINTPERIAAFLGQIGVESAELTRIEENLNYAPGRISAVWPKRFPDAIKAKPYSRNPEKLANAVYANRLGNGDEASRDGYLFRGRGLIQVTGRANYEWLSKLFAIDLINLPDTLLEPKWAALSAGAFWNKHELNDKPFDEVTRIVSGSLDTLTRRERYRDYALELLNGAYRSNPVTPSVAPVKAASAGTSDQSWFS
jgi:putative chitinase